MNDLISRQAAIAHAVPLNLFGREVMMVSVSELENLPSAQPVRHARLINAHPYGECSCCGELIDSRDRFRYCPQCGARLDEQENQNGK